MSEKKTTKEFRLAANKIHGNRYGYQRAIYRGNEIPIEIFCKIHKYYFWQRPNNHLQGQGCKLCGNKSSNKERNENAKDFFKAKARMLYKNNHSYGKVIYITARIKVKIYCKIHRKYFMQVPHHYLKGHGCPDCGNALKSHYKFLAASKSFFTKAKEVHPGRYNYSEFVYKGSQKKGKIFCNHHKEYFFQDPSNHLAGKGCQKCGRENQILNTPGFLARHLSKVKQKEPCFFYYLKLTGPKVIFFKLGITNNLKRRMSEISRHSGFKVELLHFFKGTRISVSSLEEQIKIDLKDFKLLPNNKFSGYAECFGRDILSFSQQPSPILGGISLKFILYNPLFPGKKILMT